MTSLNQFVEEFSFLTNKSERNIYKCDISCNSGYEINYPTYNGLFFILNNEVSLNKPILKTKNVSKTESIKFYDINMSGYISNNYVITKKNDITLFFYGKIKNHMNLLNNMTSKCHFETIIDLYLTYGFQYMIQLLEGEFVIALLDNNLTNADSKLFISRDKLGLCPLYILTEETTSDRKIFGFATSISHLQLEPELYKTKYNIEHFPPGKYSYYSFPYKVLSYWKPVFTNMPYFISWSRSLAGFDSVLLKQTECLNAIHVLQSSLKQSIKMDIKDSINPPKIACLLSGGINSCILTGLIYDYYYQHNYDLSLIHTFSVGFQYSEDLKYAKQFADHLQLNHTEIILSETDYMNSIPNVISILETHDIATIRYGVALYHMIKYIKNNTDIKCVFTGDGANEIMGGYLNFYYISNNIHHDNACYELLNNFYKKGGLYKKIFEYFQITLYRPFLNDIFISNYMVLNMNFRYNIELNESEFPIWDLNKKLLRLAFSKNNYRIMSQKEFIPNEILLRTGEPGYDGISSYNKPMWQIVITNLPEIYIKMINNNEPIGEYQYYKDIYEKYFPNGENIVLEKPFQFATLNYEPSMRKLDIFLDFHMEFQDRSL